MKSIDLQMCVKCAEMTIFVGPNVEQKYVTRFYLRKKKVFTGWCTFGVTRWERGRDDLMG